MTLWSAAEAARATGGETAGDWTARGVSIDTRTLRPGDLFVALKAARDGHDFVADALQRGAAAALVSRRPDGVAADAPLLMVDDVQAGLEALGRAGRTRSGARIVAITGSVGKTSTKEMFRTVLSRQGPTHAAEASHNNHWGVPLTLARLLKDARFAVVEIGMNAPGEIGPLARMTRPHVAMITTVAPAHLAAFDSVEGIAREKAAIFQGLGRDGVAVLNGDVETAPILRAAARAAGAKVIEFGRARGAHHRLISAEPQRDATIARGRAWRTPILFKLGTPGRHFALNAMGLLACLPALGADRARALCALAGWAPVDGRGARETRTLDPADEEQSFDLIDDAFNANPASMEAALDVLAAASPRDGVGRVAKGRRIAVLGDMLELGPAEGRLHAALARHPSIDRLAAVHCVGERMRALWEALPPTQKGQWSPEAEGLAARARHLIDAGDVILIKGSKASRVSLVVEALRNLGPPLDADGEGA